jgi:hypothetical protein
MASPQPWQRARRGRAVRVRERRGLGRVGLGHLGLERFAVRHLALEPRERRTQGVGELRRGARQVVPAVRRVLTLAEAPLRLLAEAELALRDGLLARPAGRAPGLGHLDGVHAPLLAEPNAVGA